jgi:hypothetical protein
VMGNVLRTSRNLSRKLDLRAISEISTQRHAMAAGLSIVILRERDDKPSAVCPSSAWSNH